MGRGGIVGEELLRQPYGAERQADHVADVATLGNRHLTASAAQVEEQHFGGRQVGVSQQAKVNQAAFFQAGNRLDFPSCGRAHPGDERGRVSRVAQSACGDHAHAVRSVFLDGAMKPPKHADRRVHGFGGEYSKTEDRLA
jgi:IS5 family transposase